MDHQKKLLEITHWGLERWEDLMNRPYSPGSREKFWDEYHAKLQEWADDQIAEDRKFNEEFVKQLLSDELPAGAEENVILKKIKEDFVQRLDYELVNHRLMLNKEGHRILMSCVKKALYK